jgi:phosphatidylglycerophosphate synthase
MYTDKAFPTLQDIHQAHTLRQRHEYVRFLPLARYVLYPVAFLLTWISIRMRLTTEAVSWFSGLVGLLGYLCLIIGGENLLPLGIGLLICFNFIDCVDGSIARTMNTQNPYGRFLDSIMVWIDLGFWALIGIMAYRYTDLLLFSSPFGQPNIFWLAVGCLTNYFSILVNYVEIIFDRCARDDWDRINEKPDIDTTHSDCAIRSSEKEMHTLFQVFPKKAIQIINHNLRVRETHYALLIIAYLFDVIDVYLLIFLIYFFSNTIMLIYIYSKRCKYLRDMKA